MNLRTRIATAFVGASLLVSSVVGVANALPASVVINPGTTFTAEITSIQLENLTFSQSSTTSTGTIAMTASDLTGNYAGWSVTVDVPDFTASGRPNIPTTNFLVGGTTSITGSSGQAWAGNAPTNGATVDGSSWTGAATTFSTEGGIPTSGSTGSYSATMPVKLTIPAGQPVATYSSNVTVTMTGLGK